MATRIQDIDTSWFNATLNFSLVDDVAYEFQNAGSHDIYYHESGTEPDKDTIGLILRPGESWRTLRQIAGLNVYFRTDSSNPNYISRLILQESTVFNNGGGGSTNPGGSDQEVQFNESGVFGGIPILKYDVNTSELTSSGTGINGVLLDSSGPGTDFLADDGTYKTIGGSTPGGADTQVQFNNAGGFDGISILTYDENTNELTSSGTGINGVLLDSSGSGTDFLSDDGTYKTITPTPGGSDTQVQFNNAGALDGIPFLTYNNITGDITSTGNGINGVLLTSSGGGSQALFDDGTYKAITATAGGSDTQIQYNNGGVLGGMVNGLYNDTTGDITLTSTTVNGVDLDATGGGTDFLADDGTYKTVPGSSPGGSNTQFQYNNNGAFGGVSNAIFNNISGDITLTLTEVNGVTLDSTGGGSEALFNDGTYKAITATAGGSDTQLQYNNGGILGGITSLTYNDTSGDIISTGNGINGVLLTSSGGGSQALFDDGTYKAITATAGGSDTQIQYNNSGVLGGMVNGLYNDTTGDITLTSTTVNGVDLDATGGGTDFLADDGTYKSVPADSPGGSDTQIQYNDNGVFNGTPNIIYDNGSGNVTINSATTNGVLLQSGGAGNQVLFNDGTYKSIATSDSVIYASLIKTTTAPIFTFPITAATDLSIYWDFALLQPILTNNASGEIIYYTFRAIWDIPSQSGYPARHYQSSSSITGIGDVYFTNTNSPITGLILDEVPANLNLWLQISSPDTGENTTINCDIVLDALQIAPITQFVTIFGYFQEVTPGANILKRIN